MDESRCNKKVWDMGGWHTHQCGRKIWKDGFCKQHHPDNEKKRKEKISQRQKKAYENSPYYGLKMSQEKIIKLESEVYRLRGAIEKHIIEFDKLMKEMPPNRERGMKLAESVGDLQKALKEEE